MAQCALPGFGPGALPVRLAFQGMAERQRFERWRRDGLGGLANRWTPCSSFPLHGGGPPRTRTENDLLRRQESVRRSRGPEMDPSAGIEPASGLFRKQARVRRASRGWSAHEEFNLGLSLRRAARYALRHARMLGPASGVEPEPPAYGAGALPVTLRGNGRPSWIRAMNFR